MELKRNTQTENSTFSITISLQLLVMVSVSIVVALFTYLIYKVSYLEKQNYKLIETINDMKERNNQLLDRLAELATQNQLLQEKIQEVMLQNQTQAETVVTATNGSMQHTFLQTLINSPNFWVLLIVLLVGGTSLYYLKSTFTVFNDSFLGVFAGAVNNSAKKFMLKTGLASEKASYTLIDSLSNKYLITTLTDPNGTTASITVTTPENVQYEIGAYVEHLLGLIRENAQNHSQEIMRLTQDHAGEVSRLAQNLVEVGSSESISQIATNSVLHSNAANSVAVVVRDIGTAGFL